MARWIKWLVVGSLLSGCTLPQTLFPSKGSTFSSDSVVVGKSARLAINGNGYLTLRDGNRLLFTKSDIFAVTSTGYLIDARGYQLLGWRNHEFPRAGGGVDTKRPLEPICIAASSQAPQASTLLQVGATLFSGTPVGEGTTGEAKLYDASGKAFAVHVNVTKVAENSWSLSYSPSDSSRYNEAFPITIGTVEISDKTFDRLVSFNGNPSESSPGNLTFTERNGGRVQVVRVDAGQVNVPGAFAQFPGPDVTNNVTVLDQDGYPEGQLSDLDFGAEGLRSIFSNGRGAMVGKYGVALFNDSSALQADAYGYFVATQRSGAPTWDVAGIGDRGVITQNPD